MNNVRFATWVACLLALLSAWPMGVDAAQQRDYASDPVRDAFEHHRHSQPLTLGATVIRLLPDDRDGSRHQRFIIRADSGISLLIAHNIDLAPRLQGLAVGDRLKLSGEYEWNAQGGLLHWTHRDPAGHHRPGYIEWNGRRYE